MRLIEDALERELEVPERPRRIVSLVPSVTELLFDLGAGERVVGATRFCTEPPHASPARVGGPKDPEVAAIAALAPDLVLAAKEENLRRDVNALAAAGLPVYVADVRTVEDAVALIGELSDLCDAEARVAEAIAVRVRAGVAEARRLARGLSVRVFCPVWRDPWITTSNDTFLYDVLVACGADPVLSGRPQELHGRRYPKVTLEAVRAARPEAILLPDEPWPFGAGDVEELSAIAPAAVIDGKLLAWYGARTAGIAALPDLLRRLVGA